LVRPAVLVLACLLACAPRPLPDEPIFSPRSFPQADHQLLSGLRVVVQEDHSAPLVTVAAIYGAGATSDPEEAGGLAHLVEHLTFRARSGGPDRFERLRLAGATYNAFTEADTTLYYAVGYRDALEELLETEISRLVAPLEGVTAEDLRVDRRVVLNERRQKQGGTVGPPVLGLIQARLFPASHPLGRPVMGNETSLARTTLPLAQAFVAQHYRPENCILVVSGDVRPGQVEALMKSWPAAAVASADGRPVPHRPPLAATRRPPPTVAPLTGLFETTGPVQSRQLYLAWSLPGATPDTEARLRTIVTALELVALEHKARVQLVPFAEGSILMVSRALERQDDPVSIRHRIVEALVSDETVKLVMGATPRLRSRARVAMMRELADPVTSALTLTRHLAATGRLSFYRDTLAQMRAVTVDAVAKTMRASLRRERVASLLVEPEGVTIGEGSNDVEAHDLSRSEDASLTGMGPEDVLRVARPPGLGGLPRLTLRNGLQVTMIERPAAPLARVDLLIPGGSATEVPYASLVSDVSTNGCRQAVSLGDVGGSARSGHGKFASVVSVVVPDGNLVNGLAAAADEARCRELDPLRFQAYKQALRRMHGSESAEEKASRALWEALYPGHPYGRSAEDAEALARVELEQAQAYLEAHFQPRGAVGVVVSALPAPALRPLLEEFLGGWSAAPGAAPRRPLLPPPIPRGRVIRLFADTYRSQVRLTVGCRLPVDAAALPALDVIERVVAEQANELRQAWGATYGVDADVSFFPGSAHLTLEGAVETKQVGSAVARLLALLSANAVEGPDLRTLTLARWEVARSFNLRFATGDGVADALLFAAQQGWSPAEWDRYPARLATVAPDRVQLLMKSCAGHEVVTLVGHVPTIAAQLEASGVE